MVRSFKNDALWLDAAIVGLIVGAYVVADLRFHVVPSLSSTLSDNRAAIYGTLASIFGSLIGFTITAASIIVGYTSEGGALYELKTTERLKVVYNALWSTFMSAIWLCGATTVCALLALTIDKDKSAVLWLSYFVAGMSVLTFARIWRVVFRIGQIVKLV